MPSPSYPRTAGSIICWASCKPQIGPVDRAIEDISRATELAPELGTARFQLGLLHLTTGAFDQAQEAWRPLDELDKDDPLRIFKTGMLHLPTDEFEDCVAMLEQGIPLCDIESINNDMRRVIEKVRAIVAAKPTGPTSPSAPEETQQQVLLERYGQTPDR